jgi:hypothetical protein
MTRSIQTPVPLIVGPTPTDDRRSEADKLENKIDKKRADAAPD